MCRLGVRLTSVGRRHTARARGCPAARRLSRAARKVLITCVRSALICFGVKCRTRMPSAVMRAWRRMVRSQSSGLRCHSRKLHLCGDARVRPPGIGHCEEHIAAVQAGIEHRHREPGPNDQAAELGLTDRPHPVRNLGQDSPERRGASWSHERETDLEQCAERSCSQNGTVSFLNLESALRKDAKLGSCYRARKLRAISSSRTHSVLVHSEVVLFCCGAKCAWRLTVLTPWSQLE